MVVVCWPVLMWLVAGWDPTFCGWWVNVVNCEMSRDVIWCVFILCDAISCVLWCHMMRWDVMWWLLCDATPTCENGMVMRKHITSTPKPLDKQKSDSTTSQIQTATTISQNSMINSELRACQAVHSDKLGIKTWPNQHEASPNFLFCIAVGPKEVRLTSRLTAWSGQLDLPHAPTLAHRGACHRNAKDCTCTRPAVHTLGSRPKCVGWCIKSHSKSKSQSTPYMSGSCANTSPAHQNHWTSKNPTQPPRKYRLQLPYHRTAWSTPSYAHAKPSTATSLASKHDQTNTRPPRTSSSALRLAPKKSGWHLGSRPGAVN